MRRGQTQSWIRRASVALLCVIVMVVLTRGQQHPALQRQREALIAWRLASRAAELLDDATADSVLGALLAIESVRRFPTPFGDRALRRALARFSQPETLLEHDAAVWAVAFSPDGGRLATGSEDHTARVWSLEPGEGLGTPVGREAARLKHRHWVVAVAFSPDGRWLATGDLAGLAHVWQLDSDATGVLVAQEALKVTHGAAVFDLAFSPDGKWLATGGGDGNARMSVLRDEPVGGQPMWEEVAALPHDIWVEHVAFSPDGRWLATTSGGVVTVWTVDPGASAKGDQWHYVLRTLYTHLLWKVAFSPDSRSLVAGAVKGTVRIWRWEDDGETAGANAWREILRVEQEQPVTDVAFSGDGCLLASAGLDGTVHVWQPARRRTARTSAWQEVARLTHSGSVDQVAFGPEELWLLTRSGQTVRVWMIVPGAPDDVTHSREVARMVHGGRVTSMAFSPDGRWLATGSEDGTAHVWLWRPSDLIAALCSCLPRNFTRSEWRMYLPDESHRVTCPRLP